MSFWRCLKTMSIRSTWTVLSCYQWRCPGTTCKLESLILGCHKLYKLGFSALNHTFQMKSLLYVSCAKAYVSSQVKSKFRELTFPWLLCMLETDASFVSYMAIYRSVCLELRSNNELFTDKAAVKISKYTLKFLKYIIFIIGK